MKNMVSVVLGCMIFLGAALTGGCSAPESFVKTMEPGWFILEIPADRPYDQAWACVMDTLVRRHFDFQMLSKQDGYMRSDWLHTWTGTGETNPNYRVRVIVKFNPDRSKVEVRTEAEYGGVQGYDSNLLDTLKGEIAESMGINV